MTQAEHRLGLAAEWRLWWDYERDQVIGGGPVARINQIRRRGDVLLQLVGRGLKVQYGESVLGYGWSLLEPALLIAVYWVVFGRVARLGLPYYPLFIATALMPWLFFNATLSASTSALRANAGIIRTVRLPREIYVLAVVGEQFVEFVFSLPIVFVVGALYGIWPSRMIVWLPVAMLVELVLVTGCALMLSAMNALLRDVSKILRVFLRVLFYLTPVLYPTSRVSGSLGVLYQLNPVVGILQLTRAVWYPNLIPTRTLFAQFGVSVAGAVLLLVVGWWVFVALERQVLKEL